LQLTTLPFVKNIKDKTWTELINKYPNQKNTIG